MRRRVGKIACFGIAMARCAHAILPTLSHLDGPDSVGKGGTSAVPQLYARAAFAHPCMGLSVKRGFSQSMAVRSFLLKVQFLSSTAEPFLRPDHAQRQ